MSFLKVWRLNHIKVHKSKGRALIFVYIKPSKNKIDRLRTKKYILTFFLVFYLTQPSSKHSIYFDFKKQRVHYATL